MISEVPSSCSIFTILIIITPHPCKTAFLKENTYPSLSHPCFTAPNQLFNLEREGWTRCSLGVPSSSLRSGLLRHPSLLNSLVIQKNPYYTKSNQFSFQANPSTLQNFQTPSTKQTDILSNIPERIPHTYPFGVYHWANDIRDRIHLLLRDGICGDKQFITFFY